MKKLIIMSFALIASLSFIRCSEEAELKENPSRAEKLRVADTHPLTSESSLLSPQDTVNSILSFALESLNVTGEIFKDPSFNVISCVVPDSTDITSLIPTFTTTKDVTKVVSASGMARNFSKLPQAFYVYTNKPYPTKYYYANVNFENDFLIFAGVIGQRPRGISFELGGNFGLPLSDYKATYMNTTTSETTLVETGFDKNFGKGYLLVPVPGSLQPGQYKVTISRRNITKEIPGFITVK